MEIVFIIIGIVIVALIFIANNSSRQDNIKSGKNVIEKISDDTVTVATVLQYLEGWKPEVREGRKNGFTEKDVQDDLEIYLKKYFHSVTREYAIEGKNVKRIDFDLGNGKVGLEIKLAESVLKEGEGDRVIGQMLKFKHRKYSNENLIIAVAGFAEHTRHTVIHEVKEFVEANKAHFIFLKARHQK